MNLEYYYALPTTAYPFKEFFSFLPMQSLNLPEIKNVIFNDPATIVIWDDETKTIVKCQKDKGDVFNKETGLALAIAKKAYGNRSNFNEILKKWCDDEV